MLRRHPQERPSIHGNSHMISVAILQGALTTAHLGLRRARLPHIVPWHIFSGSHLISLPQETTITFTKPQYKVCYLGLVSVILLSWRLDIVASYIDHGPPGSHLKGPASPPRSWLSHLPKRSRPPRHTSWELPNIRGPEHRPRKDPKSRARNSGL